MTVYEELIERVENGECFCVDFEKQTIKIGKKKVNLLDPERKLMRYVDKNEIVSDIELLYKNYKYSMPSERSDKKRRTYFKALPVDRLTDAQLVCGVSRELAQARLEGFILCAVLSGHLMWEDFNTDGWFWQSQNENDLVILKSWIQNN